MLRDEVVAILGPPTIQFPCTFGPGETLQYGEKTLSPFWYPILWVHLGADGHVRQVFAKRYCAYDSDAVYELSEASHTRTIAFESTFLR